MEQPSDDDDDWECTECGYDKAESGGLPRPPLCPLCAGDTGRDGNIVRKRKGNGDRKPMIDTSKWFIKSPATLERLNAVIKAMEIPADDPISEAGMIIALYTTLVGNYHADVVLKRHKVTTAEGYDAALGDAADGVIMVLNAIQTIVKMRLTRASAN